VRNAAGGFIAPWIGTDDRKKVRFEFNPQYGWATDGGQFIGLGFGVTVKPASNVSLTLSPSFSRDRGKSQFVKSLDDPTNTAFFGRRYVFADLEQKTVSMTTRLNWTFTPTMSLELFMQPFISSNDFSNLKEFAAPRQVDKLIYGQDIGTVETIGSGEDQQQLIDPDGSGPAESFAIENQDFNFRSLRGNLVFRWEYIPGSTLFFVWTQDRNALDRVGDFDFGRDTGNLFRAPADNIFMIKATYWMGF